MPPQRTRTLRPHEAGGTFKAAGRSTAPLAALFPRGFVGSWLRSAGAEGREGRARGLLRSARAPRAAPPASARHWPLALQSSEAVFFKTVAGSAGRDAAACRDSPAFLAVTPSSRFAVEIEALPSTLSLLCGRKSSQINTKVIIVIKLSEMSFFFPCKMCHT